MAQRHLLLDKPSQRLLKKVDAALQEYNGAKSAVNCETLKTEFDRWRFEQSKQGKDWRKSVRSHKGAVTNLHRALTALDKRQLSTAELKAMQYISRMQAVGPLCAIRSLNRADLPGCRR